MSSLGWKINRIKAMSFAEIVFRIWRSLQTKMEKRRILKGWTPLPECPVTSANSLFSQKLDAVRDEWKEWFGEFDSTSYVSALQKTSLFANFSVDTSGRVNWHYDPESGISAPRQYGKEIDYRNNSVVGNCKTLWELSRHKHLIPLSVAYVVTGERRYIEKITDHIESWIDQNPYGIGVHWCSSLEVALRLIAWCFVHSLLALRDPKGLLGCLDKPESFLISIYQHVYFISHYLSRFSSANNHLIGELTGIWVGCKVFDLGDVGVRWGAFAKQELSKQAKLQIHEDGVSKEQASYYHLWVNEYLLLAWLVGLRYGDPFESSISHRIGKMSQYLLDIMTPEGEVPQIGDADDGVVLKFDPNNQTNAYHEFLAAISTISGFDYLRQSKQSNKAFWYRLLYLSRLNTEECLPEVHLFRGGVKVYPKGGYVIFGDETVHGVFNASSLGYPSIAAHGHADALSLSLAYCGKWWLVDPGTYCYHTEPLWRNYFRSTAAHNTVTINERDQSLMGGAFLWLKHAQVEMEQVVNQENGQLEISAHCRGYGGKEPLHRRRVITEMSAGKLEIIDHIEGSHDATFNVYFHFAPDVQLSEQLDGTYIATRVSENHELTIALDEKLSWSVKTGQLDPPMGWYSDTLGFKVASKTLVGIGRCSLSSECKVGFTWSRCR